MTIFFGICIFLCTILVVLITLFLYLNRCRTAEQWHKRVIVVHPSACGRGGGERVLFALIGRLLAHGHDVTIAVDCSPSFVEPSQLLRQAVAHFGPTVGVPAASSRLHVLPLHRSPWVLNPAYFPFARLITQAAAQTLLAVELTLGLATRGTFVGDADRAWHANPITIVDTVGLPGIYLPLRLLVPHATLLAYTHYPTISTAMIGSLGTDRPTVHDAGRSGRAWLLAKRAYFYLCWYLYGLAGRCLDASLVNSTWTRDHLRHVWGPTVPLAIVYPPCAVAALARVPLAAPARARRRLIVSLAQFRPEKEQDKQLAAFAQFVADSPKRADGATLVVAGGARHDLDWARVHQLERLADDLGIRPRVTFLVNAPFDEIAELLSNAAVGLHTMWNEHFGIGVVEFMAAGVVPIAHASGGPLTDIVGPSLATDEPVGFLADTVAEYAAALAQALPEEGDARAARRIAAMRAAARQRAHLFSDDVFAEQISSML